MNKIIIGLLVIAAGAGAFFLLRKNSAVSATTINKELLIGSWKPAHADSTQFGKLQYYFKKDGALVMSVPGTTETDTTQYKWGNNDELLFAYSKGDTSFTHYTVIKLTGDSLHLKGADSLEYLLEKLKN